MKHEIERRKPQGLLDYVSLAVTTFGVGYLPLAPGTWGSMVGVAIYVGIFFLTGYIHFFAGLSIPVSGPLPLDELVKWAPNIAAWVHAIILIAFLLFTLLGVWAAGRSTELLGDLDPSKAVVDEVIGQLIVFLFVPFGIGWPFVLAGFLLFRLFDIWKPYPIDSLQVLPGGIGVCADDILAGVYAGICLAVLYAVSLSI
ncbi:MAG: phosphatidylglycerophosphatase A [Pyrinomonadaceae bacterium]